MEERKYIFDVLRQSGIPGTYFCWGEGRAPNLPWFTYRLDDARSLVADGINYAGINKYRAEIYMKTIDLELIGKFGTLIGDAFGPYDYEEIWVESEKCFMIVFTFTHIPRKGK